MGIMMGDSETSTSPSRPSSVRSYSRPKGARFYPPCPDSLPPGFTSPSLRYRLEVVLVLAGLAVFVALYLGAILGVGWLILQVWEIEMRGRGMWLLLAATVFLAFLLAFFVKGLFHRRRRDMADLVEITRADEPRFFGFLEGLLAETDAPSPKRVYLSPDVNAAVFYDTSFLSLFLPVRKNLLIGLGLVNALTISEMKAVLGHELGHFAQSSMRVGSYVYIANGIIHDLVWGRDTWDDLLDGAKRIDLRLAVVAYAVAGIVWVLRRMLGGMFWLLNVAHRSLTRQMEFQADRVAVSVAGSEAIARGLYRAEFADACFVQATNDLTHAADHGIYTRDFFHHQERAAEWVRRKSRKADWGIVQPPDGTLRWLFPEDLDSKPSMWATHPPSSERERAAKTPYIPCKLDERPAWCLFVDPALVREKMTRVLMERTFGAPAAKKLRDAEVVQRWIDAEREDTAFEDGYAEMYEGRPIADDLDIAAAFSGSGSADPASILSTHAALWDERIQELGVRHRERREELQLIVRAATGQLRGATFEFRGRELPHRDAEALATEITKEMRKIDRELEKRDHEVLAVHATMAIAIDAAEAFELEARYRFQRDVQRLLAEGMLGRGRLEDLLATLGGQKLEPAEFAALSHSLRASFSTLDVLLESAGRLDLPVLRNMVEGQSLREFLTPRAMPSATGLAAESIQGDWIASLCSSYAEVTDKLVRVSRKSLGAILAQQERIAERYRERFAPRPTEASEHAPGP